MLTKTEQAQLNELLKQYNLKDGSIITISELDSEKQNKYEGKLLQLVYGFLGLDGFAIISLNLDGTLSQRYEVDTLDLNHVKKDIKVLKDKRTKTKSKRGKFVHAWGNQISDWYGRVVDKKTNKKTGDTLYKVKIFYTNKGIKKDTIYPQFFWVSNIEDGFEYAEIEVYRLEKYVKDLEHSYNSHIPDHFGDYVNKDTIIYFKNQIKDLKDMIKTQCNKTI